jgi:hypothetical protein
VGDRNIDKSSGDPFVDPPQFRRGPTLLLRLTGPTQLQVKANHRTRKSQASSRSGPPVAAALHFHPWVQLATNTSPTSLAISLPFLRVRGRPEGGRLAVRRWASPAVPPHRAWPDGTNKLSLHCCPKASTPSEIRGGVSSITLDGPQAVKDSDGERGQWGDCWARHGVCHRLI